ncbi:MAG: hypothetical protein IJI65_10025 [Lachnospiraceae bacterium]|nr:hypothetical protein [Lachnospiraceae bacterium]
MTKKRLIKPLALALGGALFMACAVNVSAAANSVTLEGKGSTTYLGPQSYLATIDGELSNNPTEIKVQAQVSGGPEIVYNVKISWGAMKFEYDYGRTWDPGNHIYTGNPAGGWKAEGVNGENNKITVKNNSNYPMTIGFDFEEGTALNTNNTQNGSVIGIFSTTNSTFTSSNQSILTKGLNDDGAGDTTATLDLEMDPSNLDNGSIYYVTDNSVTPAAAAAAIEKNMYFALAGTPDSGITTLSSYGDVGSIKVTVGPFNNATQKAK